MIDNEHCPCCRQTIVEDTNECVMTPGEIHQEYKCLNCGAEWKAIFVPVSRSITKKADKIEQLLADIGGSL